MLRKDFDDIKREYARFSDLHNPTKNTISVCPSYSQDYYFTTMMSRLSNGYFGAKTIHQNETESKIVSRTVVFNPQGDVVVDCDSSELSRYRCGVMAAIAYSKFFDVQPNGRESQVSIGYLGFGRINRLTAQVFKELFGIYRLKVFKRNMVVDWGPELKDFEIQLCHPREMWDCKAIISCIPAPSYRTKDTSFDFATFSQSGQHPMLFITQDGGWTLNETFRQHTQTFLDHRALLPFHPQAWFPYDEDMSKILVSDMNNPRFSVHSGKPSAVYLYGIAMADVIIALNNSPRIN